MKLFLWLALPCIVMLAFPCSAVAEPPKAVEVVGHFGALRQGGDEGSLGSSAAWGGTVTLPFARRWAVEVDGTTGRVSNHDSSGIGYENRRSLVTTHLVFRFGSEKAYGFAGVGPGWQRTSEEVRYRYQNPLEPWMGNYEMTTDKLAPLGYKAGVVANPVSRLLIRGEVLMQHAYAMPNVMARIGVGWRF